MVGWFRNQGLWGAHDVKTRSDQARPEYQHAKGQASPVSGHRQVSMSLRSCRLASLENWNKIKSNEIGFSITLAVLVQNNGNACYSFNCATPQISPVVNKSRRTTRFPCVPRYIINRFVQPAITTQLCEKYRQLLHPHFRSRCKSLVSLIATHANTTWLIFGYFFRYEEY